MTFKKQHINITIEQGSTFVRSFVIRDSNNNLADITTFTPYSQSKHSEISEATSFTFTTSKQDAGAGQMKLHLTAEQTRLIKYGTYLYNIVMVDSINRFVAVDGLIFISPRITELPDSSSSSSSSSSESSSSSSSVNI